MFLTLNNKILVEVEPGFEVEFRILVLLNYCVLNLYIFNRFLKTNTGLL